jgi:hypothetical protein
VRGTLWKHWVQGVFEVYVFVCAVVFVILLFFWYIEVENLCRGGTNSGRRGRHLTSTQREKHGKSGLLANVVVAQGPLILKLAYSI